MRYRRYIPISVLTVVFVMVIWNFYVNKNNWNVVYQKYSSVIDKIVPDADQVGKENVKLGIPEGIKAEAAYNAITLRWQEVEKATGYDVEADGVVSEYIYKPEFVHENLKYDTEHRYRVRARYFDKAGEWSQAISSRTVNNNDKDIAGKFEASVYGQNIVLSWAPVEGAVSYEMEADGKVIAGLGKNGQDLFYVHEGLAAGSAHSYRIRTRFMDKESKWSPYLKAVLLKERPKATIMHVVLDGKTNEWQANSKVYEDKALKTKFYAAQDEQQIVFATAGAQLMNNMPIYIDSDENPNTGYKRAGWKISGADFMVDGNVLYSYKGDGETWNWHNAGEVKIARSDLGAEFMVSKELMNKKGIYPLRIGYSGVNNLLVPQQGKEMLKSYVQMFLNEDFLKAPQHIALRAASSAITLNWEAVLYAHSYEIEIDGKKVVKTEVPSYRHTGLTLSSRHQYRIRSIIEGKKSPWSSKFSTVTENPKALPGFIVVDGRKEDWLNIPEIDASSKGLKVIQDDRAVYFLIEQPTGIGQVQLFIDSDCNPSTGYKAAPWQKSGVDYLIAGNFLYRYSGNGMEWKWQYVKEINAVIKEQLAELSIKQSDIGLAPGDEFDMGMSIDESIYVPKQNDYMASAYQIMGFEPSLLKPPSVTGTEATVKKLKISWEAVQSAEGYDVEFDGKVTDNKLNTEISYSSLQPHSSHTYRLRTRMNGLTGAWSLPQTVSTKNFAVTGRSYITSDGNSSDWGGIDVLTKSQDGSCKLSAVMNHEMLYVFFERPSKLNGSTIYIDSDGDASTGYTGTAWSQAGIDYVVESGFVYKYLGKGEDWNFGNEKELIHYSETEKGIEAGIYLQDLGKSNSDEIYIGVSHGTVNLPAQGQTLPGAYQLLNK